MKGTPTPKHIRDAVLTDIKDNGMIAAEAARKHQVHPRLVYGWIASSSTVSPGGLLSEMNKLKRQNQELLALVGRLMLELKTFKKNILS
jgi:transposase